MTRLIKKILNVLLPPVCPVCGKSVCEYVTLCPKCFADLHFITQPCCHICGRPFPFDILGESICANCLASPPLFQKARAVVVYDESSRKIILPFKHGDRLDFVPLMVKMMSNCGEEIIKSADYIVPIPLHRLRLLKRKYNQAALLAHALAKHCHKPYLPDGLKRIRSTPKQGKLSPAERKQNVAKAFRINTHYDFKNKSILLIDDVLTTGSTANECSRILLKAGAKEVNILTFATTVPK